MVNATFRLWWDVPNGRWRATVLDDRIIKWRREDVVLLEEVSQVFFCTERHAAYPPALKELPAGKRSNAR